MKVELKIIKAGKSADELGVLALWDTPADRWEWPSRGKKVLDCKWEVFGKGTPDEQYALILLDGYSWNTAVYAALVSSFAWKKKPRLSDLAFGTGKLGVNGKLPTSSVHDFEWVALAAKGPKKN